MSATDALPEAERILALHRELREIAMRMRRDGRIALDPARAMEYGLAAQQAETAASALFGVVNIAHAYLDCPAATAAIRRDLAPVDDLQERANRIAEADRAHDHNLGCA